MYDFYEEPKHLNIKKIVIILVIVILAIILISVLISKKTSTKKDDSTSKVYETSTVFYSNDNSISVELSNNLNLTKIPESDYLLALHSDNNLNIFISKENVLPNKSLSEVIEADKLAFLGNFDSYSNLSEVKELSVGNNQACTYSFHYLDKTLNTAFYLQIVWLQINNTYYIFDIDFPLDDLSFNSNIITSLLSSFKVK